MTSGTCNSLQAQHANPHKDSCVKGCNSRSVACATLRHPLGAQGLALGLGAVVEEDRHVGAPALHLPDPVGQRGQGANHHEGAMDVHAPQMRKEPDGLHLQLPTSHHEHAEQDSQLA